MYINFWHKDQNASTIKELLTMQNERMASIYNNLCIDESRAPKRKDDRDTYIRVAQFDELPCREITGYIDCDEFIAFFVLFTTEELQGKNLRKLAHVLQYSTPCKIKFDNTVIIAHLEKKLSEIGDSIERAAACKQLADWYAEMDNDVDEMRYRRLCWDSHPEYYENIRPLIQGELKLSNIERAICYSEEFFSMAPENPRVMQDLLSIYEGSKYRECFEQLIHELKLKYENRKEALGNICFHYAMYLASFENESEAIEHFKLAKNLFKEVDENHYVIQLIDDVLDELA